MVNGDLAGSGLGVKRAQLVAHASDAEKVWSCLLNQGPSTSSSVAKQHGFEIRGLSRYVTQAVHGHHGQFLEPLQGAFHEIPIGTTTFKLGYLDVSGRGRQHHGHDHSG